MIIRNLLLIVVCLCFIQVQAQRTSLDEWLQRFTGESIESLNKNQWKQVIHPADYDAFILFFNKKLPQDAASIKIHARIKQKGSEDHLWHQVSLSPFLNDRGELQYWIGYLVDIHAQKIYEETLKVLLPIH